MWARVGLATAPWSAEVIPNVLPPGYQPVPPPIPEATHNYTYLVQSGTAAWAARAWAGAVASPVFPGGGIVVAPLPDEGVTRVWAWWPDAQTLQIVRIGQDGVRTPVRGGYPRAVAEATRRNLCPNPSFEAGLNGWTQLDLNTSFAQVTTAPYVADGSYALRMTSTTTTTGAILPGTLPGAGQYTAAFNLGYTTKPTSVTLSIAWLNAAGASAGTTTLTLSADQLAASLGQSVRHVFNFAAPSSAVSGTATFTATGITAGVTQVFLDAVLLEVGTTTGTYFDGATFGGVWSGTAHLSTAILAPVQVIDDGECPLDVPIVYEVYSGSYTGGRMRADPVLLESGGRTWLTHPDVGVPIVVDLRAVPTRTHEIERGVFRALGAPKPTVITGAGRYAPTGTIGFNAISLTERDALMERFSDGQPVLLRTPYDFHYPAAGQWLSLGDLTEDREGRKAWMDAWLLSAQYDEVEAPNPALV